jgi:hypothetical protein
MIAEYASLQNTPLRPLHFSQCHSVDQYEKIRKPAHSGEEYETSSTGFHSALNSLSPLANMGELMHLAATCSKCELRGLKILSGVRRLYFYFWRGKVSKNNLLTTHTFECIGEAGECRLIKSHRPRTGRPVISKNVGEFYSI